MRSIFLNLRFFMQFHSYMRLSVSLLGPPIGEIEPGENPIENLNIALYDRIILEDANLSTISNRIIPDT